MKDKVGEVAKIIYERITHLPFEHAGENAQNMWRDIATEAMAKTREVDKE